MNLAEYSKSGNNSTSLTTVILKNLKSYLLTYENMKPVNCVTMLDISQKFPAQFRQQPVSKKNKNLMPIAESLNYSELFFGKRRSRLLLDYQECKKFYMGSVKIN